MGYRELHRMEIEEVVRRWQAQESQRAIARATGLARETVKKYLGVADELGLGCAQTKPHLSRRCNSYAAKGPASQRQSSFASCKATSMRKRKQSDRQAATRVKRLSPVTEIEQWPTVF